LPHRLQRPLDPRHAPVEGGERLIGEGVQVAAPFQVVVVAVGDLGQLALAGEEAAKIGVANGHLDAHIARPPAQRADLASRVRRGEHICLGGISLDRDVRQFDADPYPLAHRAVPLAPSSPRCGAHSSNYAYYGPPPRGTPPRPTPPGSGARL